MNSTIKTNANSDPLDEGPVVTVSGSERASRDPAMDVREQRYELIAMTSAPLVWVVHFLVSYLTNAIFCAKYAGVSGDASLVRFTILVATVIALPLIAAIAWFSYRRHRYQDSQLPHDADSSEDRFRFLGFAGFLLALLSFVAVTFTALVALFIPTCD